MSATLGSERGMRLRRTNSTSKAEDIVTEDAKVRILSYNHMYIGLLLLIRSGNLNQINQYTALEIP